MRNASLSLLSLTFETIFDAALKGENCVIAPVAVLRDVERPRRLGEGSRAGGRRPQILLPTAPLYT